MYRRFCTRMLQKLSRGVRGLNYSLIKAWRLYLANSRLVVRCQIYLPHVWPIRIVRIRPCCVTSKGEQAMRTLRGLPQPFILSFSSPDWKTRKGLSDSPGWRNLRIPFRLYSCFPLKSKKLYDSGFSGVLARLNTVLSNIELTPEFKVPYQWKEFWVTLRLTVQTT